MDERIVPKRSFLRAVRGKDPDRAGSAPFIPGVACRRKVLEWARKMRHQGVSPLKSKRGVAKEETMAAQSYDRLEGVIWYDGKLVPWNEANLHVLSHGLHYASCVFEGERAYGGQIFKSTEHAERLTRSANILDFEIPYSVAEIVAAKKLVVDKNGKKEAYVRPVAWRGSEMMGVSAQSNTIHLAIASWEWPSYFDPEQRLKGIKLDLAEYRRPDPKTAPSLAKAAGLYMICTVSKHRAERKAMPTP